MTSAMLLFLNYEGHFVEKLKRRIKTLLVPFVVWNIIFGLRSIIQDPKSFYDILKAMLMFGTGLPNGPLWYMYGILFLAFLSPVIYVLMRDRRIGLISIVFICVAIHYCLGSSALIFSKVWQYGYLYNLFSYVPTYCIGAYWGLHCLNGSLTDRLVQIGILETLFFIIGVYLDDLLLFSIRLIPLFIILWLPIHIFKSEVFTNISFLVYVLHAYFVWHWGTRLKELIEPLLLYSSLTDIFGRLMMASVVVAFALLIWLVMSFVSPQLLDFISGGRVKPFLKAYR